MKILIYTDLHFSQYSSIVRNRGYKYSVRLENEIKSINWAEQLANEYNCNAIVCLGDFFDKPELTAEELTAIQDISWSNIPHTFLVGNHEIGINNLKYSSAHLFNICKNSVVIDSPTSYLFNDTEILLLPYILESNRQALNTYIKYNCNKRLILSHNDIAGIQLGKYLTQSGFSIDEIETNCDLLINGHLHNGERLSNKIINLGNLTGQNFSEDAYKYSHNILIIDTDTLEYQLIENPYALNFYKLDLRNMPLNNINDVLNSLKSNPVISIYADKEQLTNIKNILESLNVISYKFIIERSKSSITDTSYKNLINIDHIEQFRQYILNTLGNDDSIKHELEIICK